MNPYREQAREDLITNELSRLSREEIEALTFADGKEHYDYDKFTAEGSIWIVYCYDLYSDYYKQNQERLDKAIDIILKS